MFDEQAEGIGQNPVQPAEPQIPKEEDKIIVQPVIPVKRKSNKPLIAVLILIFVFLGFLGAAAGFYYYFKVYNDPTKIFLQAIGNMSSIKSGEAITKISIKSAPTSSMPAMEAEVDIKTSFINDNSPKSSLEVTLIPPQAYAVMLEGKNPMMFLTFVDKNLFLKINNLPAVFNSFNDKWIKLENKSTEQLNNDALTAEVKQIFIETYKTKPFLILKIVGTEKIDGRSSLHYKAEIDNQKLIDFEQVFFAAISQKQELKDVVMPDMTKFNDNLQKINSDINFWIDKKSKIINYLTIRSNNVQGSFNIDASLKNINQNIVITAPTDYVNDNQLSQIISGVFGDSVKVSTSTAIINSTSSISAIIDSDNDELPDNWEIIFGTNAKKADFNDDGYSDGHEVKGGYNPMTAEKFSAQDLRSLLNSGNLPINCLSKQELLDKAVKINDDDIVKNFYKLFVEQEICR